MKTPVKPYPAGNDSRPTATSRIAGMKQKEMMRRGSSPANAAKHAGNMVPKQSTGDPNGTPSY